MNVALHFYAPAAIFSSASFPNADSLFSQFLGNNSRLPQKIPECGLKNLYSETQITRHFQFHSSPGHRKDKTVTFCNQIPKWVMGYNEYLSPISFSECAQ